MLVETQQTKINKRIEYIDYLKGLSVTWVVWFHTTHPAFVDYSFRIPLFFFISGIFFKPYPWKFFWRKKINQLIIPFIFFYLIYYIYLILINILKYHSLSQFELTSIWGIFQTYTGNESFIINPPLWFICALINLQLLLYTTINLLKKKWIILGSAIIISFIGLFYIKTFPTPFMIGRSLPFFIYYTIGYLFGKRIIHHIEQNNNIIKFIILLFFILIITFIKNNLLFNTIEYETANYAQILCTIISLIILFKHIYKSPLVSPLKFYGINSYIVLGLHEIFQTTYSILINNIFGHISIFLGIITTLLTLTTLWPIILICNKYIPYLVAKKDLIHIPK